MLSKTIITIKTHLDQNLIEANLCRYLFDKIEPFLEECLLNRDLFKDATLSLRGTRSLNIKLPRALEFDLFDTSQLNFDSITSIKAASDCLYGQLPIKDRVDFLNWIFSKDQKDKTYNITLKCFAITISSDFITLGLTDPDNEVREFAKACLEFKSLGLYEK